MKPFLCLAILATAACLIFLAACGAKNQNSTVDIAEGEKSQINEPHEYLELILQNGSSGDIDETAIVFGKHSCTFGIVGMGGSKGYLGWNYPVVENALVRWRESGQTKRESEVSIANVYEPKFPGYLKFTVSGTNVTVKFAKVDRK